MTGGQAVWSADQDFRRHFERTRPWFFGTLALAWLVDIPETLLKGEAGLRATPPHYIVFSATHVALAVIAAGTANRRFQAVYAVAWPTITLGYMTLTTLAEIAR